MWMSHQTPLVNAVYRNKLEMRDEMIEEMRTTDDETEVLT